MPSYAELEQEPWWNREVVTGPLDWLGDRLCAHYGRARTAAGVKGNDVHLKGAHRSQEWILNSVWCTSRTYTVQAGLTAWQLRLLAGFDFTPDDWGSTANRQLVAEHTRRLVDAAKAGRLSGVVEIGGTLDGRNPFGWHVVRGVQLSFDSSHVDHLHLTFDRRAVESQAVVENVFHTMIGDDMYEQPDRNTATADTWRLLTILENLPAAEYQLAGEPTRRSEPNLLGALLNRVEATLKRLEDRPPVQSAPVDPATLKAVLLDPEVLAAIAAAVRPVVDSELDEAFTGGADKD